jgi:hypothetical protein
MKNTLKSTPFNFIALLFFGIIGLHVQTAEASCSDLGGNIVCNTASPNPDSYTNSINTAQLYVQRGASVSSFTNAGDVSNSNNLGAILNDGTITLFENTNTGSINARTSVDANGIYNANSIGTIRNSGTIRGTGPGNSLNGEGIANYASIGQIINLNSISSTHSYAIENQGTITSITNDIGGVISGALGGILNSGTITSISNSGSIQTSGSNSVSAIVAGIRNDGSGSISIEITTNGSINGTFGNNRDSVFGIYNFGSSIPNLTNSGTISATAGTGGFAQAIGNYSSITNITNNRNAVISASVPNSANGAWGIYNEGDITGTISNAGTISALGSHPDTSGIGNKVFISTIINTGTISGGAYGINNDASTSSAVIDTITNSIGGVITGTTAGISNSGTITTLNNAQGAGNALTYSGRLPTNYNIIITSASDYGKLAVTSGSGATTFGIYSGSTVRNGTYASVLSGLTSSNLTSTSGTFDSYSWILTNSSGTIWDLIFSPLGPSVVNTNQSLVNTASVLQGTYSLQNSVLANSFTYDCSIFGANNICISAGGRNTAVSAANGLNNTSALLIAAYRPHPNYRIGAYADQNLSVSNPGGTVNLGNNTPLIGLFGVWNQRLNGTGAEVKVSAAYGQKNTTVTRSVVGSGATASEAGSGSSTLNSQGAQLTAKYGFVITDSVIVSPYVGVRYTQNNMGGYTEGTSSSVTAPLTYSALNTNATTALAGVGASYKVIPAVTTFASAGVETDTNTANGTYSATNASIGNLTPVNFNANPVRTRPTATVGAYYDIAKNQRLGVTGIYRQEAYQAVSTTTVMATYTIGL